MRRLSWLVFLVFLVGCAKKSGPEIKYPERLPVTEQARELSELPVYVPPTDDGKVAGLSLDDPAPFDGVLLSEEKANAAAQLRISYDEVYRLALADRRYLLTVVEIQERELYRADQIIDYKEKQLADIRDSWWERNKLQMGIMIGVVIGVGVSLAAGKIWAEIEEHQQ